MAGGPVVQAAVTPTATDLVERMFTRDTPNRLWVNDITQNDFCSGKARTVITNNRVQGRYLTRSIVLLVNVGSNLLGDLIDHGTLWVLAERIRGDTPDPRRFPTKIGGISSPQVGTQAH